MATRLRTTALTVMVCATLAAGQTNILIHDDSSTVGTVPQPGPAEAACIALGYTYMTTPDWATFTTQLTTGGPWDAAVVLHINLGGVPTTPQLDALLTYYNGGGRVVFNSWQSAGVAAHPLFAAMDVLPLSGGPAADQFVWDPSSFIACGLVNPVAMFDFIGFGIDTIWCDPIPPGVAVLGETMTPSPGNATVVVSGNGRGVFLGLMPHILDPSPTSGDSFMGSVLQEVLFGPIAPGSLSVTSVVVNPGTTFAPGSTFDVDVTVASNLATPEIAMVDLFYGPAEPVPTLPSAPGPQTTAILVPAGGSEVAMFTGVPAAAMPEIWRLHAVCNTDLAVVECDYSDNVMSEVLCIANPLGCGPTCGDCDENATFVTILDALVAAQISAGISMPNPNQLCVCDVDSTATITILDALVMAQISAGLAVPYGCSGSGGFGSEPLVMPLPLGVGTNPARLPFDLCGAPALDLDFEWSTDSGTTWNSATAHASSLLASPAPGTPEGLDLEFAWDSIADVPVGMRPTTAEFRITATDPMSSSSGSALYPGIALLPGPSIIPEIDPVAAGHTVRYTPGTDDSNFDETIAFSFPYWNSTTASLSTSVIGFGTNGGLRMTGGYTSCCSQPPLWTYSTGVPTIHAHGADGYTGTLYAFSDPTMAVFTWVSADYCCVGPGSWTVQVVLLPSGDFQIRQVAATTDAGRLITIGYSDGQSTDNSIPGATGIDWDVFPVGAATPLGHVDIGSSEPGGMATGVVLYFEFDVAAGYTVYRLQ